MRAGPAPASRQPDSGNARRVAMPLAGTAPLPRLAPALPLVQSGGKCHEELQARLAQQANDWVQPGSAEARSKEGSRVLQLSWGERGATGTAQLSGLRLPRNHIPAANSSGTALAQGKKGELGAAGSGPSSHAHGAHPTRPPHASPAPPSPRGCSLCMSRVPSHKKTDEGPVHPVISGRE